MSAFRVRAGVWIGASLLIAATVAIPSPAVADWPNEIVVTESWSKASRRLDLFARPGGGWTLAWDSHGGAGWYPFGRIQRLDPDGVAVPGWTPPVVVGETYTRSAVQASDGSVFTSYKKWDGLSIQLTRHLPDASLAPGYPSGGVSVGTGTSNARVDQPAIALDDAGGVYVAWRQEALGAAPPATRVWLTRVQADGSLAPGWPAAGRLVAEFPNLVVAGPSLARDGASGAVVVWGENATVRALRIAPDGSTSPGWPAAGLSLTTAGDAVISTPRLLESGPGHLLALWKDYDPGIHRVALQRFSLAGTLDGAWPAAGIALNESAENATGFQMITDGAQGAIVVWASSIADARATRVLATGTVATGWLAGGRPLLTDVSVLSSTDADFGFTCAPMPGGGLMFVSSEWPGTASGTEYEPRVRWILSDGSTDPDTPHDGVVIPHDRSIRTVLRAAPDGAGGALVGWELPDETGVATFLVLSRVYHPSQLGAPGPDPRTRAGLVVAPNPAASAARVEFATESEEAGVLRLFDLGGRVLREVQVAGVGQHVVKLDALDRLPAGLYILQYRQGPATRTARVTVVH